MRRRLLIEGWRFIHHSYALVAQAYGLCMLRRNDVDLRFLDVPYGNKTWRRTSGLFGPDEEAALAAMAAPEPTFAPEATLTISAGGPNLTVPVSGRRFVFGTPAYRVLRQPAASGFRDGGQIPDAVHFLTPSRWTAVAFERFGVPLNRIHVVPLGFDPEVFRPDQTRRLAMRNKLGIGEDFVFLSTGSMTMVKGIDLLLAAFARVIALYPDVRLILKGADSLFDSGNIVRGLLGALAPGTREAVASRLLYIGETLSAQRMAELCNVADSYVSPYRAEGFNLPVLEAGASGVPVICTAGGPTDDFIDPLSSRRIRSRIETVRIDKDHVGEALVPDLDDLVDLMQQAIRHRDEAAAMGSAAANHARQNFTWELVTDRLRQQLFPEG
ncbi:MAG TPA: glycosyltransferase family 4 protein [Casimicrobiaceae bacterium]|nr:glycosyltransferase family 4 protein [Casimicrobiaceae bacterium]